MVNCLLFWIFIIQIVKSLIRGLHFFQTWYSGKIVTSLILMFIFVYNFTQNSASLFHTVLRQEVCLVKQIMLSTNVCCYLLFFQVETALICVGISLAFGALFLKTYRIHLIWTNSMKHAKRMVIFTFIYIFIIDIQQRIAATYMIIKDYV